MPIGKTWEVIGTIVSSSNFALFSHPYSSEPTLIIAFFDLLADASIPRWKTSGVSINGKVA